MTIASEKNITLNISLFVIKVSLWLCFISLILLILPDSFLSSLHILKIIDNNKSILGMTALFSFSYLVMCLCGYYIERWMRESQKKSQESRMKEKLEILDLSERALLREFFLQRSSTLIMPKEELAVITLVDEGILEKVSHKTIQTRSKLEEKTPLAEYRISIQARKMLRREQIRLPKTEITARDFNKFKVIRPDFSQMIRRPSHAGEPRKRRFK